MAGKFWENIKEGLKKARPDDETKQLQESFNKQRAAEANAQNERLKTTKTVVTEKITPEEAAKKTGENLEKNNKILTPQQKSPEEPKAAPEEPKADSTKPKEQEEQEEEIDQEKLMYDRSIIDDETLKDEGLTDQQKEENDIYKKYTADFKVKPLTKEQQNEVLKKAGLQPQRDLKDITDFERFMIDNGLAELDENGNLMKKKYSPGLKYILGNVGTIASVALSFLTGGRFPPIPVNKLLGQDKTDESARKFYDDTWKAYVDAKKKEQEGKGAGAGERQKQDELSKQTAEIAEKAGWNTYVSSGEYAKDKTTYKLDVDRMVKQADLQKDIKDWDIEKQKELAAFMQKLDINQMAAFISSMEEKGISQAKIASWVNAKDGVYRPEWAQTANVALELANKATGSIKNIGDAIK